MLLEPMNTWLLCEWSGMLYVGCVHVRGVACVYCANANGALWLEGACCDCAPLVYVYPRAGGFVDVKFGTKSNAASC